MNINYAPWRKPNSPISLARSQTLVGISWPITEGLSYKCA